MTTNEWIMWVVKACKQANLDVPELADRLSEEAETQPPEDAISRAIRRPRGQLSPNQQRLASCLIEPVWTCVFQAVEQGQLFGSLDRASEKYGDRIKTVLNSGSQEYQKLAKTFVTFDTELDDLAESNRALLVYHVLKEVEISIRGVFFPSAGPERVPAAKREQAMKELLAKYAPSLDREAFVNDNPVLQSERTTAKWPGIVWLVILLGTAWFVPQNTWWGKIIFYILMAIVVVCLYGSFSFMKRLILGKSKGE